LPDVVVPFDVADLCEVQATIWNKRMNARKIFIADRLPFIWSPLFSLNTCSSSSDAGLQGKKA
jgi:hypothetical protein